MGLLDWLLEKVFGDVGAARAEDEEEEALIESLLSARGEAAAALSEFLERVGQSRPEGDGVVVTEAAGADGEAVAVFKTDADAAEAFAQETLQQKEASIERIVEALGVPPDMIGEAVAAEAPAGEGILKAEDSMGTTFNTDWQIPGPPTAFERIQKQAYAIWESDKRQSAEECWLQAERLVMAADATETAVKANAAANAA